MVHVSKLLNYLLYCSSSAYLALSNIPDLIAVVYLQVSRFRKEDTSSKTSPPGQRTSVKSSSLNRTHFTLIRRYTYNLLLTTPITLMLPSYTRPLHRGLKALTPLSLQPVLLELVGMTTLQIASQQLIGLPIKVLRLVG